MLNSALIGLLYYHHQPLMELRSPSAADNATLPWLKTDELSTLLYNGGVSMTGGLPRYICHLNKTNLIKMTFNKNTPLMN